MAAKKELTIPDVAQTDPNAFELARVWIAKKGQHVSLRAGTWEDPAAWGIMLADLARHVAESYRQTASLEPEKVLARIRSGWEAEMGGPTDTPSGKVSQ